MWPVSKGSSWSIDNFTECLCPKQATFSEKKVFRFDQTQLNILKITDRR
jgi:hypothetical protein